MILVGGMTRMPRVVEAVKSYFQRPPCTSVNPRKSSPWARRSRRGVDQDDHEVCCST